MNRSRHETRVARDSFKRLRSNALVDSRSVVRSSMRSDIFFHRANRAERAAARQRGKRGIRIFACDVNRMTRSQVEGADTKSTGTHLTDRIACAKKRKSCLRCINLHAPGDSKESSGIRVRSAAWTYRFARASAPATRRLICARAAKP
jgi:hypothetical protein